MTNGPNSTGLTEEQYAVIMDELIADPQSNTATDSMSNYTHIPCGEWPSDPVPYTATVFSATVYRDIRRVVRARDRDEDTIEALVTKLSDRDIKQTAAGNPTGFAPAALANTEQLKAVVEACRDHVDDQQ